jgi:hypothetical protein
MAVRIRRSQIGIAQDYIEKYILHKLVNKMQISRGSCERDVR